MAFDFNQDLQAMMDMFANCDVSITLSGALVKSIHGIFDQSNEVVSPFESDRIIVKPLLTVLDKDFTDVTSANVLTITRDGATSGKDYKLDGKPRPDGAGMTIIHLAEKI
jgi:hypothetical protein